MKILKRFFWGLIIGLAKVIPGVSGSMIAISLNIYEPAINSFCNFFSNIKKNFLYLCPLFIGIIISIIFSSKIVIYLLNNYYVITIFSFLGLIIGSIHDVCKHTNKKYTSLTVISFTILFLLSFKSVHNYIIIDNSLISFIIYFIIGFIDAMCMIIPGLSGTAVLMMLGCYEVLMQLLSSLTDFSHIIDKILFLLPFSIGLFIGILFFTKVVHYLFNKYYEKTYNVILGFLLASILCMIKSTFQYHINIKDILISLIIFTFNYFVIKKINHL